MKFELFLLKRQNDFILKTKGNTRLAVFVLFLSTFLCAGIIP